MVHGLEYSYQFAVHAYTCTGKELNTHVPVTTTYHILWQISQLDVGGTSSFIRELDVNDKNIRIKQLYVGDVGCVVWDAAIVLICKFLDN